MSRPVTVDERDCIQLSLPVNAAYVSAARLTASSIANRMAFEIDEIEDIKAAVSEACTLMIRKLSDGSKNNFQIKFHLQNDILRININTQGPISMDFPEEEMSLVMIKALMDQLSIECAEDDMVSITMIKNHKAPSFD